MTQLNLIRQGNLLADIDDAIKECSSAVVERNKSGKVVITLTIKPATKTASNSVIISDEVTTKLPKLPTGESILFAGDDGELFDSDPRQGKLAFEKVALVDKETGEVIHTTEPSERFQKVN